MAGRENFVATPLPHPVEYQDLDVSLLALTGNARPLNEQHVEHLMNSMRGSGVNFLNFFSHSL